MEQTNLVCPSARSCNDMLLFAELLNWTLTCQVKLIPLQACPPRYFCKHIMGSLYSYADAVCGYTTNTRSNMARMGQNLEKLLSLVKPTPLFAWKICIMPALLLIILWTKKKKKINYSSLRLRIYMHWKKIKITLWYLKIQKFKRSTNVLNESSLIRT